MGIHITSKSWRAPLQLIDSWLPVPTKRCSPRSSPAPLLQRFVRAGWLGQAADEKSNGLPATEIGATACTLSMRTPPVRIVRPAPAVRASARLVISGRMADVCAELDRLAAMEQPSSAV